MQIPTKIRRGLSFAVLVISSFGLIANGVLFYNLVRQLYNDKNTSVLGEISGKEGYVLRYSSTVNGGLTFTGNSLCLAEAQAGHGSCGTFTSTDLSLQNSNFSPATNGTTADWKVNSSSSKLNIPADAEILHAELIWGGSYKYLEQDLTDQLNNPIKLQTPTGSFQITPDSSVGGEIASSNSYVRSQNITEIIKQSGAGQYTVGSVPALIVPGNPYNNYAGYTIAVAFKSSLEPARNLNIFVAAEQVGTDQFTNIAEVTGFTTPSNGTVGGRLFVSAQEGDHMYKGDRMKFGNAKNSLVDLSGPNNSKDNFFASQINNNAGEIDQTGTFGTKNQRYNKANEAGTRQGWDITSVDISNQLQNNQTTAYAQGTSTGDSYIINALGMQILVNSAKPEVTSTLAENSKVCDGQTITVQMEVENKGSATSVNTVLSNLTSQGLILDSNSVKVDGQAAQLNQNSLNLGDLAVGQKVTVTYNLQLPQQITLDYSLQPKISYNYQMTQGGETITSEISSPVTKITRSAYCGPDLPPVAVDDVAETKEKQTVSIPALSNDSDPNLVLQPETLAIISQPTNGTASVENGQINYTPANGFTGTDSLEYKICNSSRLCDQAKVEIVVKPTMPPVAADDTATTLPATEVTIDSLVNDSDPDGQVEDLTLTIENMPSNGNVRIEDKKFVYLPNDQFTGQDSFTYKICDVDGLCDSALVTIQVQDNSKFPPVAQDDVSSTEKNLAVEIKVLENDSDPDDSVLEMLPKVTIGPKNGNFEVLTNGSIKYTPNPGFVGVDEFTYEICDKDQQCETALVKINVIDPEKPEVVTPGYPITNPENKLDGIQAADDFMQTDSGQPVSIPVLNNDTTENLKDIKVLTEATNGTLKISDDGKIVYTPNPGFAGDDEFVYQICDQSGNCDEAKVILKVKPKGMVLGDLGGLIRSGGYTISGFTFFLFTMILSAVFILRSRPKLSEIKVEDYPEY